MSRVHNHYDEALASATINQESIQLGTRDLSVEIDGTRYTAAVKAWTVEGLKAAIAEALGEHCTLEATRRAAKEVGAWPA